MGFYIEPREDKREWCDKMGVLVAQGRNECNVNYDAIPDNKTLVCLVDNGFFYAGGIAFCKRQFEVFDAPDGRPKRWYVIPTAIVRNASPMYNDWLKKEW